MCFSALLSTAVVASLNRDWMNCMPKPAAAVPPCTTDDCWVIRPLVVRQRMGVPLAAAALNWSRQSGMSLPSASLKSGLPGSVSPFQVGTQ